MVKCCKKGCIANRAVCNFPHEKDPLVCISHKEEGMVFKKCLYCDKDPKHSLFGSDYYIYCDDHEGLSPFLNLYEESTLSE